MQRPIQVDIQGLKEVYTVGYSGVYWRYPGTYTIMGKFMDISNKVSKNKK